MRTFFEQDDNRSTRISKVISLLTVLSLAIIHYWHMYEYEIWFFDMSDGYGAFIIFGAALWAYRKNEKYHSELTALFLVVLLTATSVDMYSKINTKNYIGYVLEMKNLKLSSQNQERELINKLEAQQ